MLALARLEKGGPRLLLSLSTFFFPLRQCSLPCSGTLYLAQGIEQTDTNFVLEKSLTMLGNNCRVAGCRQRQLLRMGHTSFRETLQNPLDDHHSILLLSCWASSLLPWLNGLGNNKCHFSVSFEQSLRKYLSVNKKNQNRGLPFRLCTHELALK